MKINKSEIPVIMQGPGTVMRTLGGQGNMNVAFNELPKGTNSQRYCRGLITIVVLALTGVMLWRQYAYKTR